MGTGILHWLPIAFDHAIEADQSRYRASGSIGDARGRGVLARLPELEDSTFLHGGQTLRVRQVWIEEITQVRYPWHLMGNRRVVRLGAYRLVVLPGSADGTPLPHEDLDYLGRALCVTSGHDTISGFGARRGGASLSRDIGAVVPGKLAFHAGPPVCPKWEPPGS